MSDKNLANLIVAVSSMVSRMDSMLASISTLATEQSRLTKQQSVIIDRLARHDHCRNFDPHPAPQLKTETLRRKR